jgi:serine/threonine protein kinase
MANSEVDKGDENETYIPSAVSVQESTSSSSKMQPSDEVKSSNVGETQSTTWSDLLSTYRRLLSESPIRREDFLSVEEFARRKGLWLMLDSVPLDVVEAEVAVRHSLGDACKKSDYVRRFPHLMASIDRISIESDSENKSGSNTAQANKDTAKQTGTHRESGDGPPSPPSLMPGKEFGQYKIEQKIGRGGMGAVYKATHTHLGKTVAIKVLPDSFSTSPERVQRFQREMRVLGRLDHPNIVRAMDAGEVDGIHYLAMEYVDGIDLAKMVGELGPCTPESASRLLAQVAIGLSVAHDGGLVHRDIKPANVLVTKEGAVKIADMGLARFQDSEGSNESNHGLTAQFQTLGTPDYMAPEQWAGASEADGRADLYSLGCTLYFLLSGKAPFGTPDLKSTSRKMQAHMVLTPPALTDLRIDVPPKLEALYKKLMEKSPENRPQTALDVYRTINEIYPNGDHQSAFGTSIDLGKVSQLIDQQTMAFGGGYGASRRWTIVAGGGLVALLLLGGLFSLPRSSKSPVEDFPTSVETSSASLGVSILHKESDMEIFPSGTIGVDSEDAKFGALARLNVELKSPRYCYVFALNPTDDADWSIQLLYPDQPESEPEQVSNMAIPSRKTSYVPLTDGAGQVAYVLVESASKLPPFSDWVKKHPELSTWKKCDRIGVWQFKDGEMSLHPPPKRGYRAAIVDIAPPELSEVLANLNETMVTDRQKLTAVAFRVVGSETP